MTEPITDTALSLLREFMDEEYDFAYSEYPHWFLQCSYCGGGDRFDWDGFGISERHEIRHTSDCLRVRVRRLLEGIT